MNDIVLPSTHPTPDELLRAVRELVLLRREMATLSVSVAELNGKLDDVSGRLKRLEADAHNHALPVKEVSVTVPASEKKTTRKKKADSAE